MMNIAIYGAGGFGREVLTLVQDITRAGRKYDIMGFFDDGLPKGTVVNGLSVLGGLEELNAWPEEIAVAVAVGNPQTRKNIVEGITNGKVTFPPLIHPTVLIGDWDRVRVGEGSLLCAGNILTTDIRIGRFVILNLACTVGHDAHFGDYAAFMPSCSVSGEVTVGECTFIGTGASIINQITIGDNTVIGAGAVVIRDIPSDVTAVGVPAKIVKY